MTTPTTVQVQIQLRGDTASNWTAANPVLLNNELGLETDTKKLKVGNGSTAWNSLAYFPSIVTGGTVLGNLEIGTTGTLTFEGSTADGFETTLGVINPTADRTINLPNQSGTVVVSGNATIVDADIAANAEIAVSKLADGAARQLLQTDAAGTGVEWTSNVDVPGTLDVTGAATFDAAVTIAGDLTVNGTTTTIDTETLLVKDKNIELAVVDTPTDTTADGGGITLKGATDKTITWSDTTDSWTFNQPTITTGTSTAASFIPTGSTVPSNGVYLPSANNVAISTNGTGRLFVASDGKVGVGTTPASTLHVNTAGGTSFPSIFSGTGLVVSRTGSSAAASQISIIAGNAANSVLAFGDTDSESPGSIAYLNDVDAMRFATSTTERMRLDSSGRLGLGTSSPVAGLDVRSTVAIRPNSTNSWTTAIANGVNILTDVATNNNAVSVLALQSDRSDRYSTIDCVRGSNSSRIGIAFQTSHEAAPTEKVRITSDGLVGIGTTAPACILHLESNDGEQLRFNRTSASSSFASWYSNGTVYGYVGGASVLTTGGSATDFTVRAQNNLLFAIGTQERARIDSSGRLLVGTSTAFGQGLLRVNSNASIGSYFASAFSNAFHFVKSRSATAGQFTVVQSGDELGQLLFQGTDGAANITAASILAAVDGTPGTNDMPGRLVFSTTAEGSASPTERMRIKNNGTINFSNVATYADNAAATTGGLAVGDVYRTSTGQLMIRY